MAGENGIYLVFRKYFDQEKGEHHRPVGRFVVHNGNISVVEDHDGIVEGMFPPGELGSDELRRMRQYENGQSAHWELVREDDLNQGKRPDMAPELDLGGEAWPPEGE